MSQNLGGSNPPVDLLSLSCEERVEISTLRSEKEHSSSTIKDDEYHREHTSAGREEEYYRELASALREDETHHAESHFESSFSQSERHVTESSVVDAHSTSDVSHFAEYQGSKDSPAAEVTRAGGLLFSDDSEKPFSAPSSSEQSSNLMDFSCANFATPTCVDNTQKSHSTAHEESKSSGLTLTYEGSSSLSYDAQVDMLPAPVLASVERNLLDVDDSYLRHNSDSMIVNFSPQQDVLSSPASSLDGDDRSPTPDKKLLPGDVLSQPQPVSALSGFTHEDSLLGRSPPTDSGSDDLIGSVIEHSLTAHETVCPGNDTLNDIPIPLISSEREASADLGPNIPQGDIMGDSLMNRANEQVEKHIADEQFECKPPLPEKDYMICDTGKSEGGGFGDICGSVHSKELEPEIIPSPKAAFIPVSKKEVMEPTATGAVQQCLDQEQKGQNRPMGGIVDCISDLLSSCAWFDTKKLEPHVVSALYWRDPKKSGAIFGIGLIILLSLAYFSVISVTAYVGLAVIAITLSFRIYKSILQAVQKTQDGHPFKDYLDYDVSISPERSQQMAKVLSVRINAAFATLRHLILVEDIFDSLKFGLLLWCLTYIGAWFNGLTLIILGFIGAFTLPIVYEKNKTQIDKNIALVLAKYQEISTKVRAAIPFGKKKEE